MQCVAKQSSGQCAQNTKLSNVVKAAGGRDSAMVAERFQAWALDMDRPSADTDSLKRRLYTVPKMKNSIRPIRDSYSTFLSCICLEEHVSQNPLAKRYGVVRSKNMAIKLQNIDKKEVIRKNGDNRDVKMTSKEVRSSLGSRNKRWTAGAIVASNKDKDKVFLTCVMKRFAAITNIVNIVEPKKQYQAENSEVSDGS